MTGGLKRFQRSAAGDRSPDNVAHTSVHAPISHQYK
jgi:hypothetical protein